MGGRNKNHPRLCLRILQLPGSERQQRYLYPLGVQRPARYPYAHARLATGTGAILEWSFPATGVVYGAASIKVAISKSSVFEAMDSYAMNNIRASASSQEIL